MQNIKCLANYWKDPISTELTTPCFQNADTKSPNSFFDIAIGALEIMDHCTTLVDGESYTQLVNGQQFFRDGWNVVITAANC